ncbi:MAG: hypothetical protein HY887_01015 [Deltaproteobacteria bacterium]|nr:hypothetical protein [Deltaproteobacteria bacterium]
MNSFTQAIISAVVANKRLLPAFGIIIILVALLVARAGYNYHRAVLEEIASNADKYAAFQSMLERADELKRLKGANEERVREFESGLLNAEKPSIGAAKLQEAFKALASKRMISVSSERALPVVYTDRYARVPVEFQFKARLYDLKELLYDIQASSVLMGVRSVRIKASEADGSSALDVTIVVEGAIRKQTGA